ncbi:MAG: CDP-alcohol phosphatidyltransferase family protein [Candidatus Aenigmatarchaeota archaeon]
MLSAKKKMFEKFFDLFTIPLEKAGITPNQITLLTPIFAVLFMALMAGGYYLPAVLTLVFSVFFDALDGHLARRTKKASKYGAYLDTILDRYVEFIIYLTFLFLALPKIIFAPEVWVSLCIFGSLMTTYSKAAFTEKTGRQFSGGFLERAERMLLIILGVILLPVSPAYLAYILIILAILTNISALHRIILALRLCTLN